MKKLSVSVNGKVFNIIAMPKKMGKKNDLQSKFSEAAGPDDSNLFQTDYRKVIK